MILSLNLRKQLLAAVVTLLAIVICSPAQAQDAREVRGVVLDALKVPVAGASVRVLQASASTKTDNEGKFLLNVPANRRILQVSHIGKATQDVNIGTQDYVVISLKDSTAEMDEVIVVGYGKQKRESVVAAVSQTTGKVLERAGGVSSIGAALTGNVPGLITAQSTGLPGEEDPQLLIRGRGTWNNSSPIVLVDGVERTMNSVDIGSVETVTVLKDASATAVFGSRGANGVILITTKRGKAGRASIRGTVNTIMKVPSKLPGKYDAYDALRMRNQAIEYELALRPEAWGNILPEDILQKYRNPANQQEAERYPNVDWVDALFNDYATSNNANVNISGGTKAVRYFTSVDFLSEGDLFKIYDNGRGYKPGYGFKRLNVRSNLDFQLTPTTLLKTNLSGSYGVRKSPWGFQSGSYGSWIDAYTTAPDVFLPQYSDGTWGYYAPNEGRAENSPRNLALGGVQFQTTTRITTDFVLEQNLDMLVKGLRFSGTLSMDNNFVESDRGVNDLYNDAQRKWIDPVTGIETYKLAFNGVTNFDFQEGIKWSPTGGNVGGNDRRLFYQLQLNYAKNIAGKHNVTAMGLLNRNVRANGSQIPSYREDWVFRTTYTYDNKYTIEYNGAYNGSERFSPDYRFAFFSSGGVNWIVSREDFMNSVKFVDMLKVRASYGQTGFDDVSASRFLYLTDWGFGGRSRLGMNGEGAEQSPYNWYRETSVGNPNVQWEQSEKINLGVDYELFRGLVKGKFDFFQDKRSRILLSGDPNANPRRTVPSYYGATPPVANLGRVNSKGYEIELNFSKNINRDARIWADLNLTHSQNKVIEADDPALLPDYQKNQGYQIGQVRSHVSQGYYNTWDELYGSTMHNANDNQKLPGNYHIVDYNGDGIIDAQDNVPYGHTGWPQNTYNATIGFDYKGFSLFAQFYGVNNVTRQVVFNSMTSQSHLVYEEGTYWSKDNVNADVPMLRWLSTPSGFYRGTQYMHDGAYLRLKNAEVAYTFTSAQVKRFGLAGLRIYLNGNNLLTWTKMPDDRESNFAGTGWASQGAYPTVKRYNLGANITF